ncbi:MAG: hypothetical protein HYZ79_04015, partial [Candidatus Melainabacteria bacterium]|nr:hypothetical protein [Candidatus Melainabacteria bacterium]
RGASQEGLKARHNAELVGSLLPASYVSTRNEGFEEKSGLQVVKSVALAANSFIPFNTHFKGLDVNKHFDHFPGIPSETILTREIEELWHNLPKEEIEMMYKYLAALISDGGDSHETADYLLQAMPPDIANYVRQYGMLGNHPYWNTKKITEAEKILYDWNIHAGKSDAELFPLLQSH